ncbi:MAG: factor-independent urate hydroxylase [Planctomycetota bacterium]
MTIRLAHNTYGKHRVRVSKIRRDPSDSGRHQLVEATVNVVLEGDLASGYTDADNSGIVATDTCKNTIYVLAKDDPFDSVESFGICIAEHFISQYDHLTQATVTLRGKRWQRLLDCPHAFTGNDSEVSTARVVASRDDATTVQAGIDHCVIAKTTQSGFADFHRDEFRTLSDTDDRIIATSVTADWVYATIPSDFAEARSAIRSAMMARFIDHYSVSVQQTLMLMGEAALSAWPGVGEITLTMPNKHHVPFDLTPFGRENHNDVFVVTDEPYGYIQATVRQSD